MIHEVFLGYVAVFALGALVAVAELISRYRDRPAIIARAPGAYFYTLISGLSSCLALWLAHVFGWTFGAQGSAVEPTQVLVAGIAAIAFFRSSFFLTKFGDTEVGIGPSVVLLALLTAADRSVDRQRASERSDEASRLMQPVAFEASKIALPTLCLALLQNTTPEEQESLGLAVRSLEEQAGMSDRQRSLALGLKLMNLAGPAVLEAAIRALGDEILRKDAVA